MENLRRLRTEGLDLASSIERTMAVTDCEPRVGLQLGLEQLNDIFDQIAASSSFSSHSLRETVRAKHGSIVPMEALLLNLFTILKGVEAKWVIRMLSKDYRPAEVPDEMAMRAFHFLLPDILHLQNSIPSAVLFLDRPRIRNISMNSKSSQTKGLVLSEFLPQVGVMMAQPTYEKARSITHCCQLAGYRRMSVERKYDGEYCQIHVKLVGSEADIKIFSKSGRDSTMDRVGIHRAIRRSLDLGTAECKIKDHCILEGELLVWSDSRERIEPFFKIRRHVRRSGRFIGTACDPPADTNERLLIMFYDILLVDNHFCAKESHIQRRDILESLVRIIPGQTDVGTREIIKFSSSNAAEQLRKSFSWAISQRWEGFVLKGCDDPYYSFSTGRSAIKLKKDYFPGLGDTADFVILGGLRDTRDAYGHGIGRVWWTSFCIGCMENKDDVCRSNARPRFRLLDMVDRHGISKQDFLHLNRHGYFTQVPANQSIPEFDIVSDITRNFRLTSIFRIPFVVEVMGAGFDKPANVDYHTLRFPRVLKIHNDRSMKDIIGFLELQQIARRCLAVLEE